MPLKEFYHQKSWGDMRVKGRVDFRFCRLFNKYVIKTFADEIASGKSLLKDPLKFLNAADGAPIVYPNGEAYQYAHQHVQSGRVGIQPLETWMNLILGISGELLILSMK